jgi:hypothetical protein
MEIQIKAKLNNIFKRGDFTNKDTGEIKVGKYQLEFISQKEVIKGAGFETVIERISIPDELYPKYQNMIGKDIVVTVGAMAQNKRVIFYGIAS